MNNGYIEKRMSKNAYAAHKRGEFTLSKVNARLLRENGFNYSVKFFKWLCKKGYVKPLGFHHTGVAANMTRFYSLSTVGLIVEKYNLDTLYEMYLKKISISEMARMIGIKYAKVRTSARVLGMKSSAVIELDVILYNEICYFSKQQSFVYEEGTAYMIQKWDKIPDNRSWENNNKDKILRMLVIYKQT